MTTYHAVATYVTFPSDKLIGAASTAPIFLTFYCQHSILPFMMDNQTQPQPSVTALRLRQIRADNPGWSTAKNVKWQAANQEKRHAHKCIERALRRGEILRYPCACCGSEQAQAHHDDYSKPFDVIWLCQIHHRERHRQLSMALDPLS